MGRPSKGARWWHDKATDRFFIRDRINSKEEKFSLGFGKRDEPDHERRVEAELAKYIAKKHAGQKLSVKHQDASQVVVADVVAKYIEVRILKWELYDEYEGPPARVHELQARLSVLLDFFGEMTIEEIDHTTVEEFVDHLDNLTFQREVAKALSKYEKDKKRRDWKPERDTGSEPVTKGFNPKAAIRYLDDLNAAISTAAKTKLLRYAVKVPTPRDYKPREAVLTRKQLADLIGTAWRKRGHAFINNRPVKDAYIWRHLARFLLIAIYTGSRKDKVWRVSFKNEKDRPWVEFKEVRGNKGAFTATFHRLGDSEVQRKKKQAPEIPVPGRLAAHLFRWREKGLSYPCEGLDGHAGNPSGAMSNLFNEVLGEDHDVVIHTLRHTAATWLVARAELPLAAIASYLGMSVETLVRRYAKVRKVDQARVGKAFTQSRAGSEYEGEHDGSDLRSGRFVPPKASKALTETDRNETDGSVSESVGNQKNVMKSEDVADEMAA
ncbi:hypothetical protein ACC745_16775 [Rhizobium ruizarguesonis]